MKKRLIIAALALGALAGCNKEKLYNDSDSQAVAVKFSASSISTRTTVLDDGSDAWESGDMIGVTTSGISSDYVNSVYLATTTQSSTSTDFDAGNSQDAIFYDVNQSSDITFYAYYPWAYYPLNAHTYTYVEGGSDYVTVDISDQENDLGAVDFMTAQFEWSAATHGSETVVDFEFEHKLSKLIFNLTFLDEAGAENADKAVSATIYNVVKSRAYDIQTGTEYDDGVVDELISVPLTIALDDDDPRYGEMTAILHPSALEASEISIMVDGKKFSFNLSEKLEAGRKYEYNVTVGRNEITQLSSIKISDWNDVDGDAIYPQEIKGDGTRNNPYQIFTEEQLLKIGTGDWYGECNYILMNDIRLSSTYAEPLFTEFTSNDEEIDATSQFSGTFNGNGYTITNPSSDESATFTYFAIFKEIGSNGEVSNLTICFEVTEYYSFYVGAIAYSNYGVVSNCSCEGEIYIDDYSSQAAGLYIVYYNYGVVSGCSNSVVQTKSDIVLTDCIVGINKGVIE